MMIFMLGVSICQCVGNIIGHNVYRYEWFAYDDFYVRHINVHIK
jgi:hypothetical protein